MANAIRKNFNKLKPPEKARFIAAVREMLLPADSGDPDLYTKYPEWHKQQSGTIHSAIPFLAWHRVFIRLFELDLMAADVRLGNDGKVSLPYWDWTVDRSSKNALWAESFLGPAGDSQIGGSGPSTVVSKGSFAHPDFVTSPPDPPGWIVSVTPSSPPNQAPAPVPLTRILGRGNLGTALEVATALKSKVFDTPPFNSSDSKWLYTKLTADTTAAGNTITVVSTRGFAPKQEITIGSVSKIIDKVTSETVLTLTTTVGSVIASGQKVADKNETDPSFFSFRNELEGWRNPDGKSGARLHNRGHVWVNGVMGSTATSPIDPVFFMHHCNVDRIWAQWQAKNPKLVAQYPSDATIDAYSSSTNRKLTDPLIPSGFTPATNSGLVIPASWKTINTEHVLNWQKLGHADLKTAAGDSYQYDDDPVKAMSFN